MKKSILALFALLFIFCISFVFPNKTFAGCTSGQPVSECKYHVCYSNNQLYCCTLESDCDELQGTINYTGSGDFSDVPTLVGIESIFGRVVTYSLGIAAIVLFVLLIIGGFKFITSGGDPKAVEGARKTLTSAIVGLIVILISYLILVLIKAITGVDVTQFKITL